MLIKLFTSKEFFFFDEFPCISKLCRDAAFTRRRQRRARELCVMYCRILLSKQALFCFNVYDFLER